MVIYYISFTWVYFYTVEQASAINLTPDFYEKYLEQESHPKKSKHYMAMINISWPQFQLPSGFRQPSSPTDIKGFSLF